MIDFRQVEPVECQQKAGEAQCIQQENQGRTKAKDHQACNGGADETREVEHKTVDGDRGRQMFTRHKAGDQRQPRRLIDADHRSIDPDDQDQERHGHQATRRKRRQDEGQHHVDALTDHQEPPSIKTVGKGAAERADHQGRC